MYKYGLAVRWKPIILWLWHFLIKIIELRLLPCNIYSKVSWSDTTFCEADLDLDCLSISHGCIYSYFDLFIARVVFVPRSYTYMYEVWLCLNAFEHFIILLMKSDSYFLKKSDSCISTNSTCTKQPSEFLLSVSSHMPWVLKRNISVIRFI